MKSRLPVSVIMPTFNRAAFIAQAIESVRTQDYPDWELIIVDDGSTDGTDAAVSGLLGGNIRCLRQDRQGPAAARNRGLSEARGSLIAFLDSDDYYLPGKLRAQAEMLAQDKNLGAVHSGWRKVDERGALLEEVEPWRDAPVLDLKTWLMWKPVFLGGIMIRAGWLRRTGGFNPRLYQTDDVEMMFRLSAAGCRMEWLKRPTVCYRQHAANITRDGLRQAGDLMAAVESFFSAAGLPARIRGLERDVRLYTLQWLAFELWRSGDDAAMADRLMQTAPLARQPGELLAVAWHSHLIQRGLEHGFTEGKLAGLAETLSVLPLPGNPDPASVRRTLEWLYEAWWAGGRGRRPGTETHSRPPDGYTPREIVKKIQAAIVATPQRDSLDDIAGLWSDLLRTRAIPASARHEVTTLYLTVFSQSVFRRKVRRAAAALAAAIRSGAALRALPAWGRFFRAALMYAVSPGSRKRNTMADIKARRL